MITLVIEIVAAVEFQSVYNNIHGAHCSSPTMSGSKRSWKTMAESDDEEEPSMGRQTLPVARLPESFAEEPMDGMQYLFTVR